MLFFSSLIQGNNGTSNSTANSTVDPASANATSKILDTVTKVGGSLMRQLVAGDKPTKMSLPNMDVEMSQVADDADEDEAGFKLPSMTSLTGNQTSDGSKKSVGAMVWMTGIFYIYHENTKIIYMAPSSLALQHCIRMKCLQLIPKASMLFDFVSHLVENFLFVLVQQFLLCYVRMG